MKKKIAGVLVLLTIAGISAGCSMPQKSAFDAHADQKTDKLIIAGSGSNIAVTRKLAATFCVERKLNMEIPNSIGSGGGITGVANGSINLGLTSRSLTEEERKNGLKELPYARSGLVVAAGAAVPDDNVSYEDLVKIYRGEKSTWSNGETITVFMMYEKDSTNEVLMQKIPGFKEVLLEALQENRWRLFYNQQAQEQALKQTPSAIGFINMSGDVQGMKVLKVEGIMPSEQTVLDGSYALFKDLNYVYKEPLDPAIQAFVEFAFSQPGREIIIENKCIPLGK